MWTKALVITCQTAPSATPGTQEAPGSRAQLAALVSPGKYC